MSCCGRVCVRSESFKVKRFYPFLSPHQIKGRMLKGWNNAKMKDAESFLSIKIKEDCKHNSKTTFKPKFFKSRYGCCRTPPKVLFNLEIYDLSDEESFQGPTIPLSLHKTTKFCPKSRLGAKGTLKIGNHPNTVIRKNNTLPGVPDSSKKASCDGRGFDAFDKHNDAFDNNYEQFSCKESSFKYNFDMPVYQRKSKIKTNKVLLIDSVNNKSKFMVDSSERNVRKIQKLKMSTNSSVNMINEEGMCGFLFEEGAEHFSLDSKCPENLENIRCSFSKIPSSPTYKPNQIEKPYQIPYNLEAKVVHGDAVVPITPKRRFRRKLNDYDEDQGLRETYGDKNLYECPEKVVERDMLMHKYIRQECDSKELKKCICGEPREDKLASTSALENVVCSDEKKSFIDLPCTKKDLTDRFKPYIAICEQNKKCPHEANEKPPKKLVTCIYKSNFKKIDDGESIGGCKNIKSFSTLRITPDTPNHSKTLENNTISSTCYDHSILKADRETVDNKPQLSLFQEEELEPGVEDNDSDVLNHLRPLAIPKDAITSAEDKIEADGAENIFKRNSKKKVNSKRNKFENNMKMVKLDRVGADICLETTSSSYVKDTFESSTEVDKFASDSSCEVADGGVEQPRMEGKDNHSVPALGSLSSKDLPEKKIDKDSIMEHPSYNYSMLKADMETIDNKLQLGMVQAEELEPELKKIDSDLLGHSRPLAILKDEIISAEERIEVDVAEKCFKRNPKKKVKRKRKNQGKNVRYKKEIENIKEPDSKLENNKKMVKLDRVKGKGVDANISLEASSYAKNTFENSTEVDKFANDSFLSSCEMADDGVEQHRLGDKDNQLVPTLDSVSSKDKLLVFAADDTSCKLHSFANSNCENMIGNLNRTVRQTKKRRPRLSYRKKYKKFKYEELKCTNIESPNRVIKTSIGNDLINDTTLHKVIADVTLHKEKRHNYSLDIDCGLSPDKDKFLSTSVDSGEQILRAKSNKVVEEKMTHKNMLTYDNQTEKEVEHNSSKIISLVNNVNKVENDVFFKSHEEPHEHNSFDGCKYCEVSVSKKGKNNIDPNAICPLIESNLIVTRTSLNKYKDSHSCHSVYEFFENEPDVERDNVKADSPNSSVFENTKVSKAEFKIISQNSTPDITEHTNSHVINKEIHASKGIHKCSCNTIFAADCHQQISYCCNELPSSLMTHKIEENFFIMRCYKSKYDPSNLLESAKSSISKAATKNNLEKSEEGVTNKSINRESSSMKYCSNLDFKSPSKSSSSKPLYKLQDNSTRFDNPNVVVSPVKRRVSFPAFTIVNAIGDQNAQLEELKQHSDVVEKTVTKVSPAVENIVLLKGILKKVSRSCCIGKVHETNDELNQNHPLTCASKSSRLVIPAIHTEYQMVKSRLPKELISRQDECSESLFSEDSISNNNLTNFLCNERNTFSNSSDDAEPLDEAENPPMHGEVESLYRDWPSLPHQMNEETGWADDLYSSP